MDVHEIINVFMTCMQTEPINVQRCAIGIGNMVYFVECEYEKYIFRCSVENNAYADTVHWLNALSGLQIPVPHVLHFGRHGKYSFLILNYIEGEDLGIVYPVLTKMEKRMLAREVIDIQRKVSALKLEHVVTTWTWYSFINEMLDRAEARIIAGGYFDSSKVMQLKLEMYLLSDYFSSIRPVPYLDDISTKNLLVLDGRISGIIDIDWIGVGDCLTFTALSYVALVNMDYETDYVDYLLDEMGCSDVERKAFLFYCLLYCVDFMGERGMRFGDKIIEVNDSVIRKLNLIYDNLWASWKASTIPDL